MPNKKVDDFRVSGTVHDKRVKLSVSDKIDIIALHADGMAIRELSRVYRVSRRAIQFILFPERLEHNKQLRADRGGTMQYYDKTKHAISIKAHRDHKKKVIVGTPTNFSQGI